MSDDLFADEPGEHLSVEALSEYFDQELPPERAGAARAHLQSCYECSDLARRLEDLDRALGDTRHDGDDAAPTAPDERRAAAVAAALTLYDSESASRAPTGSRPRHVRSTTVAAAIIALVGVVLGGMLTLEFDGRSSSSPALHQSLLVPARVPAVEVRTALTTVARSSATSACPARADVVGEAGRRLCVQVGSSVLEIARGQVRSYSLSSRDSRGLADATIDLIRRAVIAPRAVAIVNGEVVGQVRAERAADELRITGVTPKGASLLLQSLGPPA